MRYEHREQHQGTSGPPVRQRSVYGRNTRAKYGVYLAALELDNVQVGQVNIVVQ